MSKSEYILASRKNDWDSETVLRIEGVLYHRVTNGGYEGGHEHFRPSVTRLTRAEAIRLMLEFEMEPEEITAVLEGIE